MTREEKKGRKKCLYNGTGSGSLAFSEFTRVKGHEIFHDLGRDRQHVHKVCHDGHASKSPPLSLPLLTLAQPSLPPPTYMNVLWKIWSMTETDFFPGCTRVWLHAVLGPKSSCLHSSDGLHSIGHFLRPLQ